jgi:hypothetical protein
LITFDTVVMDTPSSPAIRFIVGDRPRLWEWVLTRRL